MKDQQKLKNTRWYRLGFNNENIPQKSNYSKDSLIHSKYTPNKKSVTSPQTKLDFTSLKNKMATISQIRKYEKSTQQKQDAYNSAIIDQTSRGLYTKRTISKNILNNSVTGSKVKQTSDYKIQTDQILKNIHPDKFQQNQASMLKNNNTIRSRRTASNGDFTDNFCQFQKYTNITVEKPIEEIFEGFLLILSQMQKQIENQRIGVNRIIDEKERYLIQMKEKVIKLFGKKQNKIKKQSLRSLISQYIPQVSHKQPLSRVTSEKVFTSAQKQKGRLTQENDFIRIYRESNHERSSRSKTKSEYKTNFDIIFGKIKEMKRQFQCFQNNQNKQTSKMTQKFDDYGTIKSQQKRFFNNLKQDGLKNETQRLPQQLLGRPPTYTKQFVFDQIKLAQEATDHYNI